MEYKWWSWKSSSNAKTLLASCITNFQVDQINLNHWHTGEPWNHGRTPPHASDYIAGLSLHDNSSYISIEPGKLCAIIAGMLAKVVDHTGLACMFHSVSTKPVSLASLHAQYLAS